VKGWGREGKGRTGEGLQTEAKKNTTYRGLTSFSSLIVRTTKGATNTSTRPRLTRPTTEKKVNKEKKTQNTKLQCDRFLWQATDFVMKAKGVETAT